MRILWVKAGKLLPVDTGGKIRSFNLLQQLSKRHEVSLLTYYGGGRDRAYEQAIGEAFHGATAVHTAAPDSAVGTAADYGRRLLSPAPYAVSKFTAAPVRQLVERWIGEERVDVAVCDFLSASLNFPADPGVPCVLFQHNVESMLWDRQAREQRHPVKRLVYRLEASKMRRYETQAVGRFQQIIAVSDADRRAMCTMTTADRISVVPTGVDTSRFMPADHPPSDGLVLFLGSMDWEPNIDGVQYFCEAVWPTVLRAVPSARFRIVGRNPAPAVLRLASDSVEVTGGVPSVLEYLHDAAVMVVPLRIGGGTRLKIYEAMAAGKVVVSTTIGAEGLDVHPGDDMLVADDPASFARAVIDVLDDRQQRRRLEMAARTLARRYDWSEVARDFENVLARVCAVDRARRGRLGATA